MAVDLDLTDHFVAQFRKLEGELRELQDKYRQAPPQPRVPEPQRGPDERDKRLAALEGQLAAAEARAAKLQEECGKAQQQEATAAEQLATLRAAYDRLQSTRDGLQAQLHEAQAKIKDFLLRPAEGTAPRNGGEKRRGSDQDLIASLDLELKTCKEDYRVLRKKSLKLESLVRKIQEGLERLKDLAHADMSPATLVHTFHEELDRLHDELDGLTRGS